MGRGPQSKLGGEACTVPDADGLLVGVRFNFADAECLLPPRRCGPRSFDGRGVQVGCCCDGGEGEGDDGSVRRSPGLHGSAFTTGFWGVLNATGAASAMVALLFRSGSWRTEINARFSLAAIISPFNALATLNATAGDSLLGRRRSGKRLSRAGEDMDTRAKEVLSFLTRAVS